MTKQTSSKSKKSAVKLEAKHVEAKLFTKTHVNNMSFTQKRPGVISTIIEMLSVDQQHAVTKREILAELCRRFADRDEAKMRATLQMQVPSGAFIEKRVVIVTTTNANDERAYYIDREATAKAQAEYAARKQAERDAKSK